MGSTHNRETPRSDHSGSEPMVPALLWVWGAARPPRLQLQSTPMATRPGRPNGALEATQHTRARTLTHQQLHLPVQGSGLRADPVPRPPLEVAAVAPGRQDQTRSHGMTGPSCCSPACMRAGNNAGKTLALLALSLEPCLLCHEHDASTELVTC